MKNLTLIIPAKNESESLPDVINELGTLSCQRKVILKEDDILTIDSIKDLNTEIIYQNEKYEQSKRDNFLFYKQRGYALSYHDLSEKFKG